MWDNYVEQEQDFKTQVSPFLIACNISWYMYEYTVSISIMIVIINIGKLQY